MLELLHEALAGYVWFLCVYVYACMRMFVRVCVHVFVFVFVYIHIQLLGIFLYAICMYNYVCMLSFLVYDCMFPCLWLFPCRGISVRGKFHKELLTCILHVNMLSWGDCNFDHVTSLQNIDGIKILMKNHKRKCFAAWSFLSKI